MKFVTYLNAGESESGLIVRDHVYSLSGCGSQMGLELPKTMVALLDQGVEGMENAQKVEDAITSGRLDVAGVDVAQVKLRAPIPNPPSCRDAYAFRQHVAAARRNRGVEMIPEFDQFPIFYFTNHHAIYGPGEVEVESDHLLRLDFELEAAIVVGKRGRNVSAEEADSYIAGYTIMNDLSARQLQMEEMKLNLGPAKGKDFATTIGPFLVTPDEIRKARIASDRGDRYNLRMQAHHNGRQVSGGNLKDMTYTFAEILERVSYGVDIYPGDVIGSGTVGTGCYLELNGTWRREAEEKGEPFTPKWLADGDEITLTIDGLGALTNRIVRAEHEYSILKQKKNVS